MEPKAKTMQERFGFSDPDLKTPKHDAIMMWLDGEMGRIASEQPEHKKEWGFTIWFEDHHQSEWTDSAKGILDSMKAEVIQSLGLDATPTIEIVKVWEKPIVDRTFTIGFADMLASCSLPYISCKFSPGYKPRLKFKWQTSEGVSDSAPSFLRDPFDAPPIACEDETEKPPTFLSAEIGLYQSWRAYFEVKPSISSVGELIRQLRMYKTYTGDTPWFVVSPDDRFESILKAQGFGFIKVPALP